MKNDIQTLRLFSPLYPAICYRDDESDMMGYELEKESAEHIVGYKTEILAAIEREKLAIEGERGLAVYLDDSLRQRVYSVDPTVEEWDGKLCGVTEVKTYGELAPLEFSELTDWLAGQFSDGWGEGLEQRKIAIDAGELYLSFWSPDKDFCIKPEEEFKAEQSSGFEMTMGGMK